METEKATIDKEDQIILTLETIRKAKRSQVIGISILGTLLAVLGIAFMFIGWLQGVSYFMMAGPITLFAGVAIFAIVIKMKKDFQKKARSILTEAVSKSLFPGSYFNAAQGFTEAEVVASGFFVEGDRFRSNDLLKATYKDILCEQCHFELYKLVSSKNGSSYDAYGLGTIYRFTFDRHFKSRLKVMEKMTTQNVKGLENTQGIKYKDSTLDDVETEYIAFNKKFDVKASDKTTAFYFLTPQMQEKIMSLEGKFQGAFFLSLEDDHLYIVINASDGSFKIPTNNEITKEDIDPVIALLSIPKTFIDELYLNSYKYKKDAE